MSSSGQHTFVACQAATVQRTRRPSGPYSRRTCAGDGTLMGVGAPHVARTRRGEYICEYIMPTTVHIPVALLEAVDRRARALKLSRNRLVVRALEREVMEPSGWSPEFLDRLRNVDVATAEAVDELMATVRAGRRSKRPREL